MNAAAATPTLPVEAPEVRCAPPEFGEGIAQFLIERIHPDATDEFDVPMVVWVETVRGPAAPDGLCGCPTHLITRASQAAMRIVAADDNGEPAVCACMGIFLE